MKFLVDINLPKALEQWLGARGHEASHDVDIAAFAVRTDSCIISKDRDFVRLSQRHGARLLWLRCGNLRKQSFFPWLESVWPQVEERLTAQSIFIEVR